ncbi:hypothetical protein HY500_02770 [Candidatus Woesearchaeota archaeon]|nr:hypothetical protein [Candidatus Woesearchaeota archaeon]
MKEYGNANNRKTIFNDLYSSQKYLLISERPSQETDKTKGADKKNSGFEERVIALFNIGSDDKEALKKIRAGYSEFRKTFFKNVYWTHYSKEPGKDMPDKFWTKNLKEEIELAGPALIITLGRLPSNFLFGEDGKDDFKGRVNKILEWNRIPVICCLHPSRNWSKQHRPEYQFDETWELIRSKIELK